MIDQTMIDNPDPVTRIRRLAKLSLEDHTFELDAAMRIWAAMDQRAAVTVERSERLVLAVLAQGSGRHPSTATQGRWVTL